MTTFKPTSDKDWLAIAVGSYVLIKIKDKASKESALRITQHLLSHEGPFENPPPINDHRSIVENAMSTTIKPGMDLLGIDCGNGPPPAMPVTSQELLGRIGGIMNIINVNRARKNMAAARKADAFGVHLGKTLRKVNGLLAEKVSDDVIQDIVKSNTQAIKEVSPPDVGSLFDLRDRRRKPK